MGGAVGILLRDVEKSYAAARQMRQATRSACAAARQMRRATRQSVAATR